LRYLLEMAGIEARIVVARALGERSPGALYRGDVYPAAMVMLRPEDGPPIFTSASERGIPFGYVGPALRGQEAVVLEPGHPTVTIGDQGSSDLRDIRIDVTLAGDGSARLTVEEHFHGMGSYLWRQNLEEVPQAELTRRFEEGYIIPSFGEGRLVSLTIDGREDPDGPLILRYVAEVATMGRRAGAAYLMAPLFESGLSRSFASLPARETTQAVMGAHTRVRLTLRAPAGAVAASGEITGPHGARATQTSRSEGDALVVEREVVMPPMLVTPAEYPDLARFCMGVDRLEAQEIRVGR
jgi:hypothetical protein